MEFHLPYSWLDVYCSGLDRLLDRCPNLLSLVHRPVYSPSLLKDPLSETFMESLWNGSITADLCSDKHKQRQSLPSLKHLTIGARNLVTGSMGSRFLETFKHLTSLELLLLRHDEQFDRLEESDVMPLTFPCLRCLAVNIHHRSWYRAQLSCILDRWRMPALTEFFAIGDSLEIIEQGRYNDWSLASERPYTLEYSDLKIICKLLGDRIHHLHLDAAVCDKIGPQTLKMILQLCPKLRSIVFPGSLNRYKLYPGLGISHANIESVTMCYPYTYSGISDSDDNEEGLLDSCTCIIRGLFVQGNVPKLQAVRLSGRGFDDVPGRYTPEVNLKKCIMTHSCVLQWADLLASRGVRLENQSQRRFYPSVRLPSDARLQDYSQALNEGSSEDEDENENGTSDASYEDDSASLTTSYEDSDVGSDDALEHEYDGEMCTTCDQRINSCEHAITSSWLEAKPVKDANKETTQGDSDTEKLAPVLRVSRDGGQIGWNDALERFSESLRRNHEWEEDEDIEIYETVSEHDG
jgi:hypothetical protein